jgi:hypothetical protein
VLDFLSHNPGGHRINIKPIYVASDPVRFNQRGAAAHERVSNALICEFITLKENVLDRPLPELRQDKRAKKCSRPACEPFVNRNDGAVVLLDLFFA